MTNRIPAIKIIKTLRRNGFTALLAGGCVRDMLLKRPAKDYDVATDARPAEITKLFKRTIQVGAKFGVVIVLLDNTQTEVATFRTDTGYADGRHPQNVIFTTPAEDAARRDFTINGMFYDPVGKKVIDYVDGQKDLEKKIIRTIGNPKKRFSEDYLRMLRAVRFSTQLNFEIAPETFSAIRTNAKNIHKISGERIAMELQAVLTDPDRAIGLQMLEETTLIKHIFTALTKNNISFAVKVSASLKKQTDFPLALAAVFSDCKMDFALDKIKILKLSNNQIRHIKFLLANRDRLLNFQMPLSELRLIVSEPYFLDLYELQKSINKAEGKSISTLIRLKKRINQLGDIELRPKPLLDGHELMKLGAAAGPSLGRLAQEMYIAQLENTIKTKSQAAQWVKNRLNIQMK